MLLCMLEQSFCVTIFVEYLFLILGTRRIWSSENEATYISSILFRRIETKLQESLIYAEFRILQISLLCHTLIDTSCIESNGVLIFSMDFVTVLSYDMVHISAYYYMVHIIFSCSSVYILNSLTFLLNIDLMSAMIHALIEHLWKTNYSGLRVMIII